MEKIWYGSTKCDVCENECVEILYDAKTNLGCWATMCNRCYIKHGLGVGKGVGQKYVKNEQGKFKKVAG